MARSMDRKNRLFSKLRQILIPAPMTRVGLFFLAEDTAVVVSAIAKIAVCQVDRVPAVLKDFLTAYFPEEFRQAFHRLRQVHEPLARRWQLTAIPVLTTHDQCVPTPAEMIQKGNELESVLKEVTEISQAVRQVHQRQAELAHFEHYVSVLADLDVDLEALTSLRFLHLRAGTVPKENVDRLRESAALGEDLVISLGLKRDRAHVLVVGAGGISTDLEGLLKKAHFESLDTASFLMVGDDIGRRLDSETRAIEEELARLDRREDSLKKQHQSHVLEAAGLIARGEVLVSCEGALECRAPVAFLGGWVPTDRLRALEIVLDDNVPNPVVVTPQSDHYSVGESPPPSAQTASGILRPGASLVSLYGTPGYDEIDPTLILTITAPLFFGMMFGDLGYGLLLSLMALAGRRWLTQWVPLVAFCGLSSAVFGLLYGSVFGVEGWMPALWLRPMEEPYRLLEVALWMGVGFVLLTFVLRGVILLRQGRRLEAFSGFNATGGAFFYIGAVFIFRSLYLQESISWAAAAAATGGIVLTSVYNVVEVSRNGSSAATELTVEAFHGVLNLFANTLSFLRLAAFALAHSALSTALFLIVEMIPATTAGWAFRVLTLAGGGAVILVLDLLAVGVQTVRLEFYEGLARYYRGDGHRYQPLKFPQNDPGVGYQIPS